MKPFSFEYRVVETVDEAVTLLEQEGTDAKLIAGGQSLGPMLNYHLLRPNYLIDINRISDLNAITNSGGSLRIGATARQASIETSGVVLEQVPLLATATSHIGFPSIRHRGTIGGSIAHNDPASEYPAVLLALDASIEVTSVAGSRVLSAEDLFSDRFLETTIGPEEMIVGITFPTTPQHTRVGFAEFEERSGDFATAGVVTVLVLSNTKDKITSAAISAFGGLYHMRCSAAEATLTNAPLTEEVLSDAASSVAADFPVGSDIYGSAHYRHRLIETLSLRALSSAAGLDAVV